MQINKRRSGLITSLLRVAPTELPKALARNFANLSHGYFPINHRTETRYQYICFAVQIIIFKKKP